MDDQDEKSDTFKKYFSKRGLFITISAFIVILIMLAYTIISPYFMRIDPIPSEGYYVDEIDGEIGQVTCMLWLDSNHFLVCEIEKNAVILHKIESYVLTDERILKEGLNNPHGLYYDGEFLYISERGKLTKNEFFGTEHSNWSIGNSTILVDGIPSGNHQTNSINKGPDGMLIWHSGSTCNVCNEDDDRNAAIIMVDPSNGNHSVMASGVRNSFDGAWVPDVGYVFTDNGRDWEGDDYPYEELNLLHVGSDYGWPNDEPEIPIPNGTLGPIGTFDPHSSANSIALRHTNSTLPGDNHSIFVSVFGSWNSVTPTGGEIIRVDIVEDENSTQGWRGENTVIVTDVFGALAISFNPEGDLFFSNHISGKMHVIRYS